MSWRISSFMLNQLIILSSYKLRINDGVVSFEQVFYYGAFPHSFQIIRDMKSQDCAFYRVHSILRRIVCMFHLYEVHFFLLPTLNIEERPFQIQISYDSRKYALK